MVIWGGFDGSAHLSSGGRYDPSDDTWAATSATGAPGARASHAAVWTGTVMIVWSGQDADSDLGTGARYNPALNSWAAMATSGGPSPRSSSKAVWTGSVMVVWGGQDASSVLRTGGRYVLEQSVDNDQDGFSECAGDCHDARADMFPGAPQTCDGVNNDCALPSWPGLEGTTEVDDDGDGLSECGGDCNDADAAAWATPGEATNLLIARPAGGPATLSWGAPSSGGAPSAMLYDTLRSELATDFQAAAFCLESDGSDTSAVDALDPPPGGIVFYLVRPQNACPSGQGPLGFDSAGTPIEGRNCP
jgi:hypothetical protein